jgi:hypothetical protein
VSGEREREGEEPSGLPDGQDEISPMGVPEDEDDQAEELPGIPEEGEGDTAG